MVEGRPRPEPAVVNSRRRGLVITKLSTGIPHRVAASFDSSPPSLAPCVASSARIRLVEIFSSNRDVLPCDGLHLPRKMGFCGVTDKVFGNQSHPLAH